MKYLFASALVLVAAPVSAEVFNGPFVGVQAGWNHEKVGSVDSKVGALSINDAKDTFVGGAFAGYDHTLANRFVVGVEGGFNLGTGGTFANAVRDSSSRINPSYGFDLTARAGVLLDPKTLVYVRGGYDTLRASVRLVDNAKVAGGHDNFDGWLAGGGIERAIGSNLSARFEYRYSDLAGSDGRFDRQQALVGIAYHF